MVDGLVVLVNAHHPTLLLHLCRQSNWDCPQLSAYVEDRDKLLTDLCGVAGCSRDHAKQVYLAVLNGGDEDFNNLPQRSKHLEAFRNELAVLRLLLTQQHRELYAQVKALAALKQARRGITSRACCLSFATGRRTGC